MRTLAIGLIGFFLVLSPYGHAKGGIDVKLESPITYVNSITGIQVRAWGVEGDIDFSPLWQRFEFIDETHGSMYRILDGHAQQVKIWNFNVRPKEVGSYTLPALTKGDITSKPSSYEVRPRPSNNWTPEEGAITTEWRIERKNPYVQQGTLVTLVIKHLYPISDIEINWPTFQGVRVIDRGTARYLNANNHRSVEKTWYLIGEEAGQFYQPEVEFSARLNRSRIEHATIKAKTKPLMLEITAIPSSYKAPWILVADKVEMQEKWSAPPNNMFVGQQRTRTIMVTANGALGEQIPDLLIHAVRGVDIEPIKPVRRFTRWVDNKPTGFAEFNYLVSARSPIPVFFDNIRLPWFSSTEEVPRQALVYALRVDIASKDTTTLINEAPILKRSKAFGLVAGIVIGLFGVIIYYLSKGAPRRYKQLAAMLWLWCAATLKMRRQTFKALNYCGRVWNLSLGEMTQEPSPVHSWFERLSAYYFGEPKARPLPSSSIAILRFNRWLNLNG